MYRLVVAACAVLFCIANAQAADVAPLVMKAAPTAAPSNWSGWYVGGNAGGVWSAGNFKVTPNQVGFPGGGAFSPAAASAFAAGFNRTENDSGAIAGVQFGKNSQTGNIVYGFEIDFNYTGVSKTFAGTIPPSPGFGGVVSTETFRSEWLNTNRVRVGYSNGPGLLYATGGVALASLKAGITAIGGPGAVIGSDSAIQFGWTVGAGAEWMVASRWSVKVEYLHVGLQNAKFRATDVNFPLSFVDTKVPVREDIVRLGINYRL